MPQPDHGQGSTALRDAASTGVVLAGRYVLGALLDSDGVERLFAARDRKLQRDVAVKLLEPGAAPSEAQLRFEREAHAAGALQHPNLVAVFDSGELDGRPFLVTELLKGATLRARLQRGPLPVDEAVRVARQVAAALAAAHEKGLAHRDLRPENIFLTDDGWVKILDFGIVGSAAPEQAQGDPAADLFAFGAVLYEMLSGKRAFPAGPQAAGPEPLPASVPQPLCELVARCLAKDGDQRIASAREVLAVFERERPSPPRRRSFGRRLLFLPAVAALLLVAFALVQGRRRIRPAAPAAPPAGTVAILPFSAKDAPGFAYLGVGIVDLLSRDLQGTALRAVDSASVLKAVGGDASADLDKMRITSAQVGANYFVLGRIEVRQGDLVLEAVIHTGDAAQPVAEAVAQGKPADLLRLVRQLSDQLQMHPLPKAEFEERLARLARGTSRSLPALRAWLEGEDLLRRGHWDEVVGAFQRAVAADTEFALAHYRLGIAATIVEPGLAEDSLRRALRHGDRLTPAERRLVQARLDVQDGNFDAAERLLVEATRADPGDLETWMQLGELYFHQNPLRGRSSQEAENPLQRVLVLDPLNTEAMGHLADLAQMRGERAVVSHLADRLLALSDDATLNASYRLARAWARGDAREHDAVLAGLRTPGTSRSTLATAFARVEWQMDGFADAAAVADAFSAGGTPRERATTNKLRAMVQLLRGRPRAAQLELQRAATIDPASDAAWLAPWIDTLDVFAVSPERLASSRVLAARIELNRGLSLPGARLYLMGALAARAMDFEAAEAAARKLEAMPPQDSGSISRDLALAVRARMLAARGNAAGALALLEREKLQVPARFAVLHVQFAENLLRASLLGALGREREALPLLDALRFYDIVNPVFAAASLGRKARLLEALGDHAGAVAAGSRFVELWKDCEPEQRPEVERARALVAAPSPAARSFR